METTGSFSLNHCSIICSVHRPVLIDALPLQSSRLNYGLSNFALTISHNPFQLTLLGFSYIFCVPVIITSLLHVWLIFIVGVFAAAHDLDIEWIVIKGISDYAGGGKSEETSWRPFASLMAASVTAHILSDAIIFQDWPHFKSTSKYWTVRKRPLLTNACFFLYSLWSFFPCSLQWNFYPLISIHCKS